MPSFLNSITPEETAVMENRQGQLPFSNLRTESNPTEPFMQQLPVVPVAGQEMQLACIVLLSDARLAPEIVEQSVSLCLREWEYSSIDARFEAVGGSEPPRGRLSGYGTQVFHVPLPSARFQECCAAKERRDGTDLAPLLGSALVDEFGMKAATEAISPRWKRIRMVTTPLGLGNTNILGVAVVVADPIGEPIQ